MTVSSEAQYFGCGGGGGFSFGGVMRIRKGPRCVPLAPDAADRSFLLKGFEHKNARRHDDVNQCNVAVSGAAATSGSRDLDVAEMERGLEVDRVQPQRLSADGYSRKRRGGAAIVDDDEPAGVISISSIIQAGVKSAKSEPASAKSVVADNTTTDCSPAMNNAADQPVLLLQSLKRVCAASQSTGLTAKEAVAKIQEQGLPGLIDGGERLIVQVAKTFRSSSAFVEREERGRYFTQESMDLSEWKNFETADDTDEEVAVDDVDFETVIEAARQLQKLQEQIHIEPVEDVSNQHSEENRWSSALRGKSSSGRTGKVEAPASTVSQKPSDETAPRCNRDDGKGWRCVRLAESGFSLCKYHRDQIRRAEIRRRKARSKSKKPQSRPASIVQPAVRPSNPTPKDVNAATVPEVEKTIVDAKATDSDHKRRRFVKAKSLKSLL